MWYTEKVKQLGPITPLIVFRGIPNEVPILESILALLRQASTGPSRDFHLALSVPARLFASPEDPNPDQGLIGHAVREDMKDLLRQGQLGFWPCGYAGTRQENLLDSELAKEIQWSLHNPWNTGLDDLGLDQEHPFLYNWADLERQELLATNRPQALFNIQYPDGPRRLVFGSNQNEFRSIEVLRTCRDLPLAGNRALLLLDSQSPDLMGELRTMVSEYPLASVLTQLSPPYEKLAPWQSKDGSVKSSIAPAQDKYGPQACLHLAELSRLRELAYPDHEVTRQILELSHPDCPLPTPALSQEAPELKPRTHLASMQGLVAMPGNACSVLFQGGTLKGFSGADWTLDCPRSPEIVLSSKSRTLPWTTQSGVSLEASGIRGLRETRASSHFDYLFLDGSDWLFLDGVVNFPELNASSEVWNATLYRFSIRFREKLNLTWKNGGRTRNLAPDIPPAPPKLQGYLGAITSGEWHQSHGNDFRFWSNTSGPCLVLRKPGTDIHRLTWRINRDRKGIWLECVAEAQWDQVPAQELSGRSHRFNLAITVISKPDEELPPSGDDWEDLLNRPWSGKVSSPSAL